MEKYQSIFLLRLAGWALAVGEDQCVAEDVVAELLGRDVQFFQQRFNHVLHALRFRRLLKLLEDRRLRQSFEKRPLARLALLAKVLHDDTERVVVRNDAEQVIARRCRRECGQAREGDNGSESRQAHWFR